MTSVLSSFFSRDPKAAFGYELPAESFCNHYGVSVGNSFKKVTMINGTFTYFQSEPTEKATCFWANSYDSTLRTQTQKLKTIRHPNVLTFFDSLEVGWSFRGLNSLVFRMKTLSIWLRSHAYLLPSISSGIN
jgi:hypothetical protein